MTPRRTQAEILAEVVRWRFIEQLTAVAAACAEVNPERQR